MLSEDIAHLMQQIPMDDEARVAAPVLKGGAFDGVKDMVSPFGYKRGEGKFYSILFDLILFYSIRSYFILFDFILFY
jgi:hypothetical protein